ncbi:hypothetical protein HaLaN_20562, partial [Haematococcus lacustris]
MHDKVVYMAFSELGGSDLEGNVGLHGVTSTWRLERRRERVGTPGSQRARFAMMKPTQSGEASQWTLCWAVASIMPGTTQ